MLDYEVDDLDNHFVRKGTASIVALEYKVLSFIILMHLYIG